jgi:hypothetical protein
MFFVCSRQRHVGMDCHSRLPRSSLPLLPMYRQAVLRPALRQPHPAPLRWLRRRFRKKYAFLLFLSISWFHFYLGGRAGGGGGTGFAGLGTGLIDGGGRGFNGGGGTGLAGWGTGFTGGAGRALVGVPGNGSRGPNRLVKGGRFVSKRLVNPGMFVPKRLVTGGRTTGTRSAAFVTTAAIIVARIVVLIFTISFEHGTCPRFLFQRG